MTIKNFSPKQLMELDACTRCGECTKYCETYWHCNDTWTAPMMHVQQFRSLLKWELMPSWLRWLPGVKRPSDDEMRQFGEGVYRCTMCARCAQACPVKIDLLHLWFAMRQELVARGYYPIGLDQARINVAGTHNVFAFPNEDRALWAEFAEQSPEDLYQREQAEYLYYVGCVSSFSPAAQDIPEAFARLLTKAGVDFSILAGEEWCCSFPLRVAGFGPSGSDELTAEALAEGVTSVVEALMRHNIEKLRQVGAKGVLFTCPSCYNTWLKHYKPHLPEVGFYHSTQFIEKLIAEERLELGELTEKVTYHDPCDLGRNSSVYEPPRRVIASVPGLGFTEVRASREKAHCCGGGGDLEIANPDLASLVCQTSCHIIRATGADTLVTACPQCKRMFQANMDKGGRAMAVKDIAQLILEAAEAREAGLTGMAASAG